MTRQGLANAQDLAHALWLMRLSYLRYLLKAATNPRWRLARIIREDIASAQSLVRSGL